MPITVPTTSLAIILRTASIRLPGKRIENKTPILEPNLAPITNPIHEDDLAQICVAAALHSANGEIYNVCDNDKLIMYDYFINVARYLNLASPPTIN